MARADQNKTLALSDDDQHVSFTSTVDLRFYGSNTDTLTSGPWMSCRTATISSLAESRECLASRQNGIILAVQIFLDRYYKQSSWSGKSIYWAVSCAVLKWGLHFESLAWRMDFGYL